jgi:hypothetical protein
MSHLLGGQVNRGAPLNWILWKKCSKWLLKESPLSNLEFLVGKVQFMKDFFSPRGTTIRNEASRLVIAIRGWPDMYCFNLRILIVRPFAGNSTVIDLLGNSFWVLCHYHGIICWEVLNHMKRNLDYWRHRLENLIITLHLILTLSS